MPCQKTHIRVESDTNMRQTLKEISNRLMDISSTVLFGYLTRHAKKTVALATLILLAITIYLGWTSAKKVREVVTEDFNQQQLILSRHAAGSTRAVFEVFMRELSLLSLDPSLQYSESPLLERQMKQSFTRLVGLGLTEIRYVAAGGRVHLVSTPESGKVATDQHDSQLLSWARDSRNKGAMYLMSTVKPEAEMNYHLALRIHMAMPVWQADLKTNHAARKNALAGVVILTADATVIAKNALKDIRSGKTGYGWMLDNHGTFLYHPEAAFIGRNAFAARKEREPAISFARINEIQQDRMLKGEEGESWFESGWHRGIEGRMKKLIAFSPIEINGNPGRLLWSVAVVAPMSEVQGTIGEIQTRQYLLEGILVIIAISGSIMIFTLLVKWSSSLKREVAEKTKELIKSDSQCRSLVENADDIIYTVDEHGSFLSMNRYGHQFFTRNPSDTLGRNIASLFPDESALSQMLTIQEVFKTNSSRQVTSPVTVDDNEYWLSTNFSGLQDENGNVYAVLGIARDITERKKMEEQMFYTEKLASIGTLAAGVAHEINNPLAIILGFADLLAEKTPPSSEAYDMIKTIEKHGTNAKRVVENLLSFTRLAEHKEEDVDINKNIEAVLAVLGNTLSLHKIALSRSLSKSLALVKGDAGELQQVLFNIINNAVHAVKGEGIITISTRPVEEGRKIEIQISDTGCGIKKEHRTRMFDPLFTTKKVGEGTGLGLFVSYGIVAKHGGTITFETKTEEESSAPGTTFFIILPAVHTHAVQ